MAACPPQAKATSDNAILAFYVRGDDLIAQWRKSNGSETVSYYGYDGHDSTAISICAR
jgi:hypothetical protein